MGIKLPPLDSEWTNESAYDAAQMALHAAGDTRIRIDRAISALSLAWIYLRDGNVESGFPQMEEAMEILGVDLDEYRKIH